MDEFDCVKTYQGTSLLHHLYSGNLQSLMHCVDSPLVRSHLQYRRHCPIQGGLVNHQSSHFCEEYSLEREFGAVHAWCQRINTLHTLVMESQLSAGNSGLLSPPVFITNSPPCSIEANLYGTYINFGQN